jgi:transcriptional regulator with XRE-family HTH domain
MLPIQIRKNSNISLTKFAKRCSIPISTFYKYEMNIHKPDEKRLNTMLEEYRKLGVTDDVIEELKIYFNPDEETLSKYKRYPWI